MGFLLVLFWCWAAPSNSRFGPTKFRFRAATGIGLQGFDLAPHFQGQTDDEPEKSKNSRFHGKNRECSAIRAAGAVRAVSSRRGEGRAERGHRDKNAPRSARRT